MSYNERLDCPLKAHLPAARKSSLALLVRTEAPAWKHHQAKRASTSGCIAVERLALTVQAAPGRNDVPVEYSGEEQAICAVGLVKPRPDVFVEAVQYLLVLCTTVEVCASLPRLYTGMVTSGFCLAPASPQSATPQGGPRIRRFSNNALKTHCSILTRVRGRCGTVRKQAVQPSALRLI